MDHDQYLKDFFAELEKLRPVPVRGRPHALAYDREAVHVLLGLGDARASLRFDQLYANPIRMAAAVIEKWQATPEFELLVVE